MSRRVKKESRAKKKSECAGSLWVKGKEEQEELAKRRRKSCREGRTSPATGMRKRMKKEKKKKGQKKNLIALAISSVTVTGHLFY